MKIKYFLLTAILFLSTAQLYAQQERKFVRAGNKQYKKNVFNEAETNYLKALEIDSTSYEALFNLTDALYQQQRIDDAIKISDKVLSDSLQSKERIAMARFNRGNIHFQKKEYDKSIEEYKKSLRLNPDDQEAKFNLAYAQLMLKDQQQKQKNKDKDKDKDKNKDKNKDQDDKKNQKDKKDQNKNDKKEGKKQPQEGQMTRKEAEQLLKAMQNKEDKTQEKVKDKNAKAIVVKGKKNW